MDKLMVVFSLLLTVAIALLAVTLLTLRALSSRLNADKLESERRQTERQTEAQLAQNEQQRMLSDTVVASLQASQESQKNAIAQLGGETSRMLDLYRQSMEATSRQMTARLQEIQESQEGRLDRLGETVDRRLEKVGATLDQRLEKVSGSVDQRLDKVGGTVDQRLDKLGASVDQQLEKLSGSIDNRLGLMQATVDEKLHKTLEERIGQSFQLVNQRLEQVYKGLGEMQALAAGVGDLKKVLSNVKTRGVLGEYQLGAILEQILSPEQYAANVATKKDSRENVEYAIRLPGAGDDVVWLPIDAKFPSESYSQLLDAYDTGDAQEVAAAASALEQRIRRFAKDIHDKYVDPPHTTDFAILFLPFEGLYAEVVRRGMVESLQGAYRINIAGPTTLAALLNSLQMGFKTLAIQKRSGEVWQILGAVKTEFDKFREVLENTQQRLDQANRELDKLVGVRTRQIQRRLKDVSTMPEDEAYRLLGQGDEDRADAGGEGADPGDYAGSIAEEE
ncbi:MAG: DNA recombination protein RmuC [Clostridiales bacterium]|nr:DNA recombination protein RmuC [Clostridiales bacterium]